MTVHQTVLVQTGCEHARRNTNFYVLDSISWGNRRAQLCLLLSMQVGSVRVYKGKSHHCVCFTVLATFVEVVGKQRSHYTMVLYSVQPPAACCILTPPPGVPSFHLIQQPPLLLFIEITFQATSGTA